MFHLKETEASAEFSGRVSDVFAALGTGSIRRPTEQQQDYNQRPDFDKQQFARAVRSAPAASNRQSNIVAPEPESFSFKRPSPVVRRPEDRQQIPWSNRGGAGRRQPFRRRNHTSASDHHRNPQNWTKYSLADVTTNQMSDRSNTSAALDFLKKLRRQRQAAAPSVDEKMEVDAEEEDAEEEENPADLSQPITFRKPLSAAVGNMKKAKKTAAVFLSVDETEEVVDSAVVANERKAEKVIAVVDDRQPVIFRKLSTAIGNSSRSKQSRRGALAEDLMSEAAVECGEQSVTQTLEVVSGASSGENRKLKKNLAGKAVQLSHLADEED